ncbi:MAG: hypothetical protein WD229_06190 [Pirellulales bacterium]
MPIMFIDKKVAVTTMPCCTKLAGTLELVGVDETITRRRVEAIVGHSQQILHVSNTPKVVELWRGLALHVRRHANHRPIYEDRKPVSGHLPPDAQLAKRPASGRLLADLVLGMTPFIDPEPFCPGRFGV